MTKQELENSYIVLEQQIDAHPEGVRSLLASSGVLVPASRKPELSDIAKAVSKDKKFGKRFISFCRGKNYDRADGDTATATSSSSSTSSSTTKTGLTSEGAGVLDSLFGMLGGLGSDALWAFGTNKKPDTIINNGDSYSSLNSGNSTGWIIGGVAAVIVVIVLIVILKK